MKYRTWLRPAGPIAAACLLFLAGRVTPAQAIATYDATANGVLEIVGITHAGGGVNLFLDGEALGAVETDATGDATADGSESSDVVAADPFNMVVGDTIDLTSLSTGDALLPDRAESMVTTDGNLVIDNLSAHDATILFEFSYDISAEAAVMDAPEWGQAFALVDVFSGLDDFVDIFFDQVFSDTDEGGGLLLGSGTIPFDITVPAGEYDIVTALVDAFGVTGSILGDVNLDEIVNGLDVDPFVGVLLNGPYRHEADMHLDGEVNGLDVDPFVDAILAGGAQSVPEPSTGLLAVIGWATCGGLAARRGRRAA